MESIVISRGPVDRRPAEYNLNALDLYIVTSLSIWSSLNGAKWTCSFYGQVSINKRSSVNNRLPPVCHIWAQKMDGKLFPLLFKI